MLGMSQEYWFKANKSGYGWHPANWKGWITLFLYLVFLVYSYLQVAHSSHAVLGFIVRFLFFTGILTIITYLKGESITWGAKGKAQHDIP